MMTSYYKLASVFVKKKDKSSNGQSWSPTNLNTTLHLLKCVNLTVFFTHSHTLPTTRTGAMEQ